MNYEVVLSPSSSVSTIVNDSSICNNMFSSNSRYSDSSDIYFYVEIVSSVTDSIVQHAYRFRTRERINNNQIVGNIFKILINDAKNISAGLCF